MEYVGTIAGTGDILQRKNEITGEFTARYINHILNYNIGILGGVLSEFQYEDGDNKFIIKGGMASVYGYVGQLETESEFEIAPPSANDRYYYIYLDFDLRNTIKKFAISIKDNGNNESWTPIQDNLKNNKNGQYQLPIYKIKIDADAQKTITDLRNIKKNIENSTNALYADNYSNNGTIKEKFDSIENNINYRKLYQDFFEITVAMSWDTSENKAITYAFDNNFSKAENQNSVNRYASSFICQGVISKGTFLNQKNDKKVYLIHNAHTRNICKESNVNRTSTTNSIWVAFYQNDNTEFNSKILPPSNFKIIAECKNNISQSIGNADKVIEYNAILSINDSMNGVRLDSSLNMVFYKYAINNFSTFKKYTIGGVDTEVSWTIVI